MHCFRFEDDGLYFSEESEELGESCLGVKRGWNIGDVNGAVFAVLAVGDLEREELVMILHLLAVEGDDCIFRGILISHLDPANGLDEGTFSLILDLAREHRAVF